MGKLFTLNNFNNIYVIKKSGINTFILFLLLISCNEKKTEMFSEYDNRFKIAEYKIIETGYFVNTDSFKNAYENYKLNNPQKAYELLVEFEKVSHSVINKNQKYFDSINFLNNQKKIEEEKIANQLWIKSKPGKIQKKFPDWTREECTNVANQKIWIGMKLEMLKYMRGKPNSVNISNYGNGNRYQWCWDNFEPRCFYGFEDGVITAYN
jgi:hypothetical protein